ncbi:MAG: NAD(P)H-hydrate dehydratase [Cyanobacteria bacterium]|nr:NAD(P)H-hydrate dehydratase [Cyanobacteriota bacterium]MDW8202961.1 NAD(P)H-hydrate dehydratase [Cyanobacteriota bacterium SKYGB_h_bin112]
MHEFTTNVNPAAISDQQEQRQRWVVTAEQMQAIEARLFAAGMPVAALMEKVAGLITRQLVRWYPLSSTKCVGLLVGPGHNGGDALVVARELHHQGYSVQVYCPVTTLKELTASHFRYITSLGIPCYDRLDPLQTCDLLIDGLFGVGLTRPVQGTIAAAIDQVNQWSIPVASIDLPSGLHTDTGEVLGTAIRATHTLCLGLWKRGLLQDHALDYVGEATLIDFDCPLPEITAVVGESPPVQRITPAMAIVHLPLHRPPATHKYHMGHLLIVAGSRRYPGAAILTGLGAKATGVGMLTIAVPTSLKSLVLAHMPDAVVIGCPETSEGTIVPSAMTELLTSNYSAIACGPGLSLDAGAVVSAILADTRPLVLDADGLNVLATMTAGADDASRPWIPRIAQRPAATILTPHMGEFRRLFPHLQTHDRITLVQQAATESGAIVLLKGARTTIAQPDGCTWINPNSTPALARGGSGDVLTGAIAGLLAQPSTLSGTHHATAITYTATWWHAQAGILAAQERTDLGVDALTLSQYLVPSARKTLSTLQPVGHDIP